MIYDLRLRELSVESCGLRLTTEYTKSTEGKGEAESFPLQELVVGRIYD